jgi:hypothetical protein
MRCSISPLFLAVILVACSIAYWPGHSGGFIFDDIPNIVENPDIHVQSLDANSLISAALSSESGILRRPISMLSFALNHYSSGLGPASYKFTNIVVHLTVILAIFFLTRQLLAALRETHGESTVTRHASGVALFVTAFFALHPIQLTSVLYVVQRMTSLSGLFTVLGLIAYVVLRRTRFKTGQGLVALFIAPPACMALALMSKENGALIPLFAGAIELVIFRFSDRDQRWDRGIVGWYTVFLFLPALVTFAVLALDPNRLLSGYVIREFTLGERLLSEARILVFYLKSLIAPSLTELGIYHDDIAISRGLFSPLSTFLSIAVLIMLAAAAFFARNRAPLVALGIAWFFVGHAMESSFLPLELAHEHRNYLAVFGIGLTLAGAAFALVPNRVSPRIASGVAIAFVGMLGISTFERATQWSNPYDHAEAEVRNHPNSARALQGAAKLYADLAMSGKDWARDPAFERFERALMMDPPDIVAETSLVLLSCGLQMSVKDAWLISLDRKLRERPTTYATVTSLRQLMRSNAGRPCIEDPQMEALLDAAWNNPSTRSYPQITADMASMYGEYLANVRRNFAGAEEKFREAVAIEPREAQYRINLIKFLIASVRPGDAEDELERLMNTKDRVRRKREITVLAANIAELRAQPAAKQ